MKVTTRLASAIFYGQFVLGDGCWSAGFNMGTWHGGACRSGPPTGCSDEMWSRLKTKGSEGGVQAYLHPKMIINNRWSERQGWLLVPSILIHGVLHAGERTCFTLRPYPWHPSHGKRIYSCRALCTTHNGATQCTKLVLYMTGFGPWHGRSALVPHNRVTVLSWVQCRPCCVTGSSRHAGSGGVVEISLMVAMTGLGLKGGGQS